MSQQLSPEFNGIDALLRSSGAAFSYPRTPDIATRVRARLDSEPYPVSIMEGVWEAMRRPVFRVATALLLVAVVAVASALAIPQSREALADLFGLSSVKLEVGPVEGPPPPVLSPDSFASPATLASAQEAVAFKLRLPVKDGVRILPDAVYIENIGDPRVVILVYESRDFDLYQRSFGFYGKGLPDADLARESAVHGQPAIWIESGGHIARSLDADGKLLIETERTVERGTLLWEEGGISYRLETGLSEGEAILVAESLR